MFLLSLTLFIVELLSLQYYLSAGIRQQLNLTTGLQLTRLQVYEQLLYCLASNQTHFQYLSYNSTQDYLLLDGSPVLEGQLSEESQISGLPSLSIIDSSKLMLIYRPINSTQTRMIVADMANLSYYSEITFNFTFTGKYVYRLRSYFMRTDNGQEGLIENFPFSSNLTLTYFYHDPNATDYIVLKSINQAYLATIDKQKGVVCLTQIIYNYYYDTLNSTQTNEIDIGTPIVSACFYQEYNLFLQTNDGHLYNLHLSTLTVETLNLTYNATQQCYFDPSSNSLILIQDTDNSTKTIVQLSLASNTTTNYSLQATNLLYLNDYVFYLADIDILTSYQTGSCSATYNPLTLKCENCQAGCNICNSSLLCNTCSAGYFLETYGSTYAQLYYYCGWCPSNCYTCISGSVCTVCNNGYSLTSAHTCKVDTYTQETFQYLLYAFTNITAITNLVPSARSLLKPILYVLISFDDLFPYMFHNRNYGQTLQSLFTSIYQTETDKWSTYDQYLINPIFSLMGANKEGMVSSLDNYYIYSSPAFIHWENNGENVLISAFSFLTTNFLVSLCLFVVFRILFNLLFRYRVSLMFRAESFWSYFSFFVMEGNLQVVTFYSCSILRLNFFFNGSQKVQAVLVYFILYFLIFLGVAGYLLIFSKLRKLCKYFTQNLKPSFSAMAFLTVECGVKNILLAMIHSLFGASSLYELQFACLSSVELMCIVNYLVYLNRSGCFQLKVKVWVYLLLSSIRLVMIGFLYVQQSSQGQEGTLILIDQVFSLVLSIYLLIVIIGFSFNLLFSVREFALFIKHCITHPTVDKRKRNERIEEASKEGPNKESLRVQNQKKMMNVYFSKGPITIKNPREYKKKEDYLKVTVTKPKQAIQS